MGEGDFDSIQGKTRAEVKAEKKTSKRKKLAKLKQRRKSK